jgi:hypothetical protein
MQTLRKDAYPEPEKEHIDTVERKKILFCFFKGFLKLLEEMQSGHDLGKFV